MSAYRSMTLTPSVNPRGRMGGPGKDIPILSFVPPMEGTWDIYVPGTPAEQIAWLIAAREEIGALAIQVQRHAAQVEALATYPEAVA